MTGTLKVQTLTADGSQPVAGAEVEVRDKAGTVLYQSMTDANGESDEFALEAPDVELTLDETYHQPAYSTYDVRVSARNFISVTVLNVEIVSTVSSFLPVMLHPNEAEATAPVAVSQAGQWCLPGPRCINPARTQAHIQQAEETIVIPPPAILSDAPRQQFTRAYQSVRPVFIPEKITVHLGRPQDTAAKNVTVPFIEYIANVASSEIYPTWPHNSLVANMHCIVTFAINRVYTEWYRSRGFQFDITNSTAYDQHFVYGRNIFDNLYQIANEVFNVYARRFGFRNPFFTQFCNGTTSTCAGLSQWGTVTLANQGKTPLQILHYYYPDDLELIPTDNIMGIEETYPGQALRVGSTGPHVQKMQVYLNRIRVNFPLIPLIPSPNGVFDENTEAAVRTFQRVFNLTSDGIIGRATWNRISFTYFGVIKLAELNSEGERASIGQSPPSAVLRQGSRGADVLELQFILNTVAAYYASVPSVIQDSVFAAGTANAVIQFQKTFGLTQDGIVGPTTWNKLYAVYKGIKNNAPVPDIAPPPVIRPPYPGTLVRLGSTGNDVKLIQTYLNTIRTVYPNISPLLVADGVFGFNTKNAVTTFQQQFLLTPDGVVGPITWDKIVDMFQKVTGTGTGTGT